MGVVCDTVNVSVTGAIVELLERYAFGDGASYAIHVHHLQPVTGTITAGDYGRHNIMRYATTGGFLLGADDGIGIGK